MRQNSRAVAHPPADRSSCAADASGRRPAGRIAGRQGIRLRYAGPEDERIQSRFRKFRQGFSGDPVLPPPEIAGMRRANEQTTPSEPHGCIQCGGGLPPHGPRPVREGTEVGRRHVMTLMRKMSIEAIYRRPNTSNPVPGHKIYPYLLRGLAVTRPN